MFRSNVIKAYNMMSRLFECTFKVEIESDFMASLAKMEMALNEQTFFVAWLCARLVLIVDGRDRVPLPPVKPTVSNP